jgi:hypothetical protein
VADSELRPRGTVELECTSCRARSWFDPIGPEVAAAATFICDHCITDPLVNFSCTACNRAGQKRHRELMAEADAHPSSVHCHRCKDIPYQSFSPDIVCWSCRIGRAQPNDGPEVPATQIKRYPKHCDCPSCWQTFYHVCDACAADWYHDLSDADQQEHFRKKGATIKFFPEMPGAWQVVWPTPTDN